MARVFLLVSLLSLLLASPVRSGLQFDGVDDQMAGAVWSTYVAAGTKTVMAWFTGEGPSPVGASDCHDTEAQAVVGNSGTSTIRLFLARRSATLVCISHRDTAPLTVRIDATHPDTTPAHVTFRHTGGVLSLYLHGVLVSSVASVDTNSLTNTLIVGGGIAGTAGFFNGRIDQIVTWNVALSPEEIAAIASAKRTRIFKTMPTALWTFENCTDGASGHGVVFQDVSGNGRTLTGNHGANLAGFTCRGSQILSRFGGIQ